MEELLSNYLLSSRAINCIKHDLGFKTRSQVEKAFNEGKLRTRNFGKMTLLEVLKELKIPFRFLNGKRCPHCNQLISSKKPMPCPVKS